jgi:uncharacterized Zn finger protein
MPMNYSICPHCTKNTDGVVKDKGTFLFIVCDKCDTILGVLPKFYQKVTWKPPVKEEPAIQK